MHTLVRTTRQWEHVSGPHKGKRTKPEVSFHASSVEIDDRHGVDYFAEAVRSQWEIETGYHARRDGAYCEDIRTRRCNENVTGAMLLARSPVFMFFSRSGLDNCQQFKEELQSNPRHVFQMVTRPTSN